MIADEITNPQFVVETGEESEVTIFSCKAKLFHYDKEWKERGIGTFKLNVNEGLAFDFGHGNGDISTGAGAEKKARFIMRTEGVHRVVLNTPVFKGMKVGSNEAKEPTGKMLNLSAVENGKFVPLLLKVRLSSASNAIEPQLTILLNIDRQPGIGTGSFQKGHRGTRAALVMDKRNHEEAKRVSRES